MWNLGSDVGASTLMIEGIRAGPTININGS